MFRQNLTAATIILNQYNSVLRHYTVGIVDVNLSHVEYCIKHLNYVEDERVMQSLLKAFETVFGELEKHPGYIKDFSERLKAVYSNLNEFFDSALDQIAALEDASGVTLTNYEVVKKEEEPPEATPVFRLS